MNINITRLLFLVIKMKCNFHLLLHLSQVIVQISITAKDININQLQNTMYKFNLSSPEINWKHVNKSQNQACNCLLHNSADITSGIVYGFGVPLPVGSKSREKLIYFFGTN